MRMQRVSKTCPVCNGSGKPTGDKSVGEILSGYCYKCHGSGQVTEYVDIPEQQTSTTSSRPSSSSDGGDKVILVLILLAIAVTVVFYVIFFAIILFPIIYGVILLTSHWRKQSIWKKILWVASWFIAYWLFSPEYYILTQYANDFDWIWPWVSTYLYIGIGALSLVLIEQIFNIFKARK